MSKTRFPIWSSSTRKPGGHLVQLNLNESPDTSRVLCRIHFSTAVNAGYIQGEHIGEWVFEHALRPASPPGTTAFPVSKGSSTAKVNIDGRGGYLEGRRLMTHPVALLHDSHHLGGSFTPKLHHPMIVKLVFRNPLPTGRFPTRLFCSVFKTTWFGKGAFKSCPGTSTFTPSTICLQVLPGKYGN
jgi:hypothetical protein